MYPGAPAHLASLPVIRTDSQVRDSALSASWDATEGLVYLVPAVAISGERWSPEFDLEHPEVKVIGTWSDEDCLMRVGAGAKVHNGTVRVLTTELDDAVKFHVPGDRYPNTLEPGEVLKEEPRNNCGTHASLRSYGLSNGHRNTNSVVRSADAVVDCAKCAKQAENLK